MDIPQQHLNALARQAIETLGRTIAGGPHVAAAGYAAGCLLELVGAPEAALEAFQRAVSEPQGPAGEAQPTRAGGNLRLLEALARCAVVLGREIETAGWLSKTRTTYPQWPELAIWEGYLLRLRGRPEEASVALEQVTHPIYLAIASREQLAALLEMDRPDEVGRLLDAVGSRDPALAEQLSAQVEQRLGTVEARDPTVAKKLAAICTEWRARRRPREEGPCPQP